MLKRASHLHCLRDGLFLLPSVVLLGMGLAEGLLQVSQRQMKTVSTTCIFPVVAVKENVGFQSFLQQ